MEDLDFLEEEEIQKKAPEKRCPICAKPPVEESICPNCGQRGICRYHIYTYFIDDRDNELKACSHCGPRCNMCAAQVQLFQFNDRRLCSKCLEVKERSDAVIKDEHVKKIGKIKEAIASIFPFLGLGLGIYLGMRPEYQHTLNNLIDTYFTGGQAPVWSLTMIWGVFGIFAGSFISTVINTFLK